MVCYLARYTAVGHQRTEIASEQVADLRDYIEDVLDAFLHDKARFDRVESCSADEPCFGNVMQSGSHFH